ncbi:MAG: YjfI family protein [Alphaproteobacteria bacterium]|nr:YjfI family protein [Alphaproteobacteria bacterium]MCB9931282.1 YjfI family protein [Alphaproteobacteria bacterium]
MPSDIWTTESLFQALQTTDAAKQGAIRLELISGSEDSIAATMADFGDLAVVMSTGAEQILAQVLLWKISDLKDPAAFAIAALRTHKLMPLSTFGITKGPDGHDYYELFGALSASSKLENVVLELETLAANAIEAVEAYADYRR